MPQSSVFASVLGGRSRGGARERLAPWLARLRRLDTGPLTRFYFLFCIANLAYIFVANLLGIQLMGQSFFLSYYAIDDPRLLFLTLKIAAVACTVYYVAMALSSSFSLVSLAYFKLFGIFCFVLFWPSFTTVKILLSRAGDFTWDPTFSALDYYLHGGVDPWRIYGAVLHVLDIHAIDYFYLTVWGYAAFVLPFLVLAFERDLRLRIQFFTVLAVVWVGLGNLMAWAFLSAGPVYFDEVTGDSARFAGLFAMLGEAGFAETGATAIQTALWQAHENGQHLLGVGISAFPSVHVGMATLVGIYLWRRLGRWGVVMLAFPALIQIFSVVLGWHYAVDGYASILLVSLAWRLIGRAVDATNGAPARLPASG